MVLALVAFALWVPKSAPDVKGNQPSQPVSSTETSRAMVKQVVATRTPDTAPSEPPTRSGPPTITVAGVGDMLFDRNVKQLIEREGGKAPLAEVAERLSWADVAVGNLETPLSTRGTRTTVKEAKYAFRGAPQAIEGLKLAGFDALSLANNHMLDYGAEALDDTVAALQDAGIGHAGAGKNTDAAWMPASIETSNGARVAFLAFSHVVPPGFWSGPDKHGVASGKNDLALIDKAIRAAKKSHDYVIVSFHWGVEYEDNANSDQVKKARRAVDAGADMVLAHHPHVIQGIEFYNGRLIAYSLGDFVFDHYSRKTGEAFIIDAELGPFGVGAVEFTPVYLDSNGRPEVVTGSEADVILERLRDISAPLGGKIRIRGDKATLK